MRAGFYPEEPSEQPDVIPLYADQPNHIPGWWDDDEEEDEWT